ncbi:hypothetical protein KBC80_01910 [Candidatus Woesebacteria bacterium]|nr:hypothetical protein [Candidatus Woesebacteria bacterium]
MDYLRGRPRNFLVLFRLGVASFLIFIFGFLLFWVASVRVGPHFQSVRQHGADVDLARILRLCDLPKHRSTIVQCLSVELKKLIPRWGLDSLMKSLTALRLVQTHQDLSVTRCHDITHQLGRMSVLLGVSMKEILTSCTELCQSGCFHGAAVGWVAKGESIGKDFTSICLLPDIANDKKISCIHGMGHAVTPMGLYDTKRSLSYCDTYDEKDRDNCGSGVFMELYDGTEYNNGLLRDLPPDRPAWCAQFAPPYDEVCYAQSGYFEHNRNHDLPAAIAVCRREPLPYQFDCLTFLGKSIYFVYPLTAPQLQGIKSYCHMALPNQEEACVNVIQTDFIH